MQSPGKLTQDMCLVRSPFPPGWNTNGAEQPAWQRMTEGLR